MDETQESLENYLRDFIDNAYRTGRALERNGDVRAACAFYGKAIAGHQILEEVVCETDKVFEQVITFHINPYVRGENNG